ncbi:MULTISPECIES: type II CAAX endopeptidase family protein [Clostridium]|uniref:CPBP family intramembrane metalloprotease n=1 Tax=Clostridium senegalense TaxID=1465809 RepID=A0A6M0H5A4_9CLOT|nr:MULTISPECIES: type II CAAX endopeptidase family protein [Clostridium]NEU04762.1 CPBP family intramembrane metalloprotease [Clostridium senegalense]
MLLPLIIDIFIILLVYFLPFIFFIYKLGVDYKKFSIFSFKSIVMIIIYTLVVLLIPPMHANTLPFFAVVLVIMYMKNERDKDYFKYNFSIGNTNFILAFKYALFSFAISIIAALIWDIILKLIGVTAKQQDVVQILSDYTLLKFLISVPSTVIFAPILEEFVFRYLFFEKFLNKFIHPIISAIITSLIFALMHFSLSAFLTLFTLSLLTCYFMHNKGFWYSVSIHMMMNLITTVSIFISKLS